VRRRRYSRAVVDDQKTDLVNVQQSERAERILDAAAELVLRHGYRRVTIEDIASRAGIGKGTVYLHWKTRESLFYALLTRESIGLVTERIEEIRQDPAAALPHRLIREVLERSMGRPLLAAMLTKDAEVLGKLVEQSREPATTAGLEMNLAYLGILRDHGLVRTDIDPVQQLYAVEIATAGFTLLEPWLPPMLQRPLPVKADTLAYVLRAVLGPDEPPDPSALAAAAPLVIEQFERFYQLSVDTIHGTTQG
jgi:AcrR family transcriptional regulator